MPSLDNDQLYESAALPSGGYFEDTERNGINCHHAVGDDWDTENQCKYPHRNSWSASGSNPVLKGALTVTIRLSSLVP